MTPFLPRKMTYVAALLSTSVLVACSDSGSSDPAIDTAVDTIVEADNAVDETADEVVSGDSTVTDTTTDTEAPETTDTVDTEQTVDTDTATDSQSETEAPTDNTTDTPDTNEQTSDSGQTDTTDETSQETSDETSDETADNTNNETITLPENSDTGLVPASVTGNDVSGSDDDSPTETESASIAAPFLKDSNRPNGPPSAPEGLTMLLAGENFVEMTWKPSTDDQSVEAYEIYRDGTLVNTIRYDSSYTFDYRSWLSTSYMDCDYTHYICDEDNPIVPGGSYSYQIAAIDNEGMRSELSQPVVFQMAQSQSSAPDLSDYALIFNEEFEGDTLDRTFWKTSLPWGENTIVNSENQYFVNLFGSDPLPVNPFVMTGTTLQITGTVTPPELIERANGQPYLSGVITTKDKFMFTYGYVEMNAKLASGDALLSTFFLFNQDFEKNKPEIDIIEYNGTLPNIANQTYHYHDSVRHRRSDGERHSTPTMKSDVARLSDDFHTYGVLWEPELVIWYIDGVEVRRIEGVRVSDEPMNIVSQLVIGSEWIGTPDPATLPRALEIDYIKAWQKQ